MNKMSFTLVCIFLLAACSQTTTPAMQTPVPTPNIQQMPTKQDNNWVYYADPVADANLASAKGDFKLLAMANRVLSFPGLEGQEVDLPTLKQQCGYRVLQGSGDMLNSPQAAERHQKLQHYAHEYNQAMLAACPAAREATR